MTTSTTTDDLVARVMSLWSTPLPAGDGQALAALAALYTDPVVVNEVTTPLADLLARARMIQRAYSGLHHVLLERVEAPDRIVVAFRLRGTHTGPLPTPLGEVAPTGRDVDIRTIDVLTLDAGRIGRVTVVGDELGNLHRLGALALVAG